MYGTFRQILELFTILSSCLKFMTQIFYTISKVLTPQWYPHKPSLSLFSACIYIKNVISYLNAIDPPTNVHSFTCYHLSLSYHKKCSPCRPIKVNAFISQQMFSIFRGTLFKWHWCQTAGIRTQSSISMP